MAVQTTYTQAPAIGFSGMLHGDGSHHIITMVNKEATQSLTIGAAVCFEGSTNDQGALAPDATTDKIAGILIHSHTYAISDMSETGAAGGGPGLKPATVLSVLVRGEVLVTAEEAVAPADRLFIRVVATGAEVEGALRKSADASDCIDSTTQGRWMTTAGAGGLAVLSVNFTAKP